MQPGTRPLPTEWKVITGAYDINPQRRNKLEPDAPAAEPTMPETLDAAGQRKWTETVDLMRQMGTLSIAYADLLGLYAESWAIYCKTVKQVQKLGAAIPQKDKEGNVKLRPNPFEVSMRATRLQLIRMEAELGLTPSAKSRLMVMKKQGVSERKREKTG